MRSLAIVALVLAVFTVQHVAANWSNSSNSSNFTESAVTVVFNRNYFVNVTAHFNHQDDVIIKVTAEHQNVSRPTLNITNFSGTLWVQNASSIFSILNHTNSSATYKFKYWSAFQKNSPCVLGANSTLTCKFLLSLTHKSTDLYFTFEAPYNYMPGVQIVGSGYNNVTDDRNFIFASEVEKTKELKRYVNLTLSHDFFSKSQERYLNSNSSDFNASWMMAELRPMFLGFQCWTGKNNFNVFRNWTGDDGIYVDTPVNLSRAGLPFDDFYSCYMTVVFTERSNGHSLIPIQVQDAVVINGSQSNHSNTTNSTTYGVLFNIGGRYSGCNITYNFTRWDGVDLTITPWSNNQSLPTLNLTNYAGAFPVRNTSAILNVTNHTSRSVTYRFNYWYADATNYCVSYSNYSIGCRFKLSLDRNTSTDLFITITNPFQGQNIKIFGTGYNNRTSDDHWIDTQEAERTEYLKNFLNLTIKSDYFSQSEVRHLNWNASNFNASWMLSTLKPVALGIQCTDDYNNRSNYVVNFTGYDAIYPNTPVNLTRAGVKFDQWYTCDMSLIMTEQSNNHAMIQVNVRNGFYVNGSANWSSSSYSSSRSNFSEYRPTTANTSSSRSQPYHDNYNRSYYSNQTNQTYYNQSRNSSQGHLDGNASWYSYDNSVYSQYRPKNETRNHTNYNQTYYNNQSRFSNQTVNFNNTSYNYTYYNMSGNRNQTYNQSRFNNQSYYYSNTSNYTNYTNYRQYGYANDSYYNYIYNYTNNTNKTNSSRVEFCDQYENRLSPVCLEKKVQQAKFENRILIGCVAVLAVAVLFLACKVCGQKKGKDSKENSPNNSYAELSAAGTFRSPQMVVHNPAQNVVQATPAYLMTGQDGNKFMVIPQKV